MRLVPKRLENAHADAIWCTAFGDNGTLYTGSVDESVKRWTLGDTPTQEKVHDCDLGCVALDVSADGSTLTTVAMDGTVTISNVTPGAPESSRLTIPIPPTEAWGARIHPKGGMLGLAGGSQHDVKLISFGSGNVNIESKLMLPLRNDERRAKEQFALSLAFSPDGAKVACGDMHGAVALFDVATGKMTCQLDGHQKPVRSLCFTPDSKAILTASDDSHVHLYDTSKGDLVQAWSGHSSWVLSVSCLPDSAHFVTGSSDNTVRVWGLGTRKCSQVLTDHSDEVWGVACSPDGKRVASVSEDASVVVYSVQ